jgi:hypothetical protein
MSFEFNSSLSIAARLHAQALLLGASSCVDGAHLDVKYDIHQCRATFASRQASAVVAKARAEVGRLSVHRHEIQPQKWLPYYDVTELSASKSMMLAKHYRLRGGVDVLRSYPRQEKQARCAD